MQNQVDPLLRLLFLLVLKNISQVGIIFTHNSSSHMELFRHARDFKGLYAIVQGDEWHVDLNFWNDEGENKYVSKVIDTHEDGTIDLKIIELGPVYNVDPGVATVSVGDFVTASKNDSGIWEIAETSSKESLSCVDAVMQIYSSVGGSVLATMNTDNTPTGDSVQLNEGAFTIQLNLSSATTATMPVGIFPYDLLLDNNGIKIRRLRGWIEVQPGFSVAA